MYTNEKNHLAAQQKWAHKPTGTNKEKPKNTLWIKALNEILKHKLSSCLYTVKTHSRTFSIVFLMSTLNFCGANAYNATHGIAMRKPSCLSVCQTRGLWQNESKFCPHSYTVLVFLKELWLVGETTSTCNFGSTVPVGAKTPIFNRYSLVLPSRNA